VKRSFSFGLDRFSGLYLLALFIIVFSIWSPHLFPTVSTVDSIASSQAVSGILAIAVLVPLIAGAYDLSVGSTANLAAIISVTLQTSDHVPMAAAIIVAVVTGTAVGVLNGFIVVRLRVNSFIATLGTGSVAAALQTVVSGNNQPLPPSSSTWGKLTQVSWGGFEIVVLYLIVLAIVAWWALEHTPFGRYLYAIGGNADAARLSGVKVGQWTWLSLVISGTLSAAGGVAFASLLGPSLTFGQGLLLPAFAAAFLGSTQLKPGRFNVWGSVIAIYVLATGVQGFQYVTGAQWLSDLFNGVALVAAVAFAVWRQRASTRNRRPTRAVDDQQGPEARAADSPPAGTPAASGSPGPPGP
jgi:ribose transport system permease protein